MTVETIATLTANIIVMPGNPRRDWFDKGTLASALLGVIVVVWSTVLTHCDQDASSKQNAVAIDQITALAEAEKTAADGAQQQINIMKRQLEQASAEQRPWLPAPDFALFDPLIFQSDGDAQISFKIVIRNTGRSPAMNVTNRFRAEIITKQTLFNSIPNEKELCAEARKDADFDPFRGAMILPGAQGPEEDVRTTVSHEKFASSWPRSNDLLFRIVGCADYTFGTDSRRHGQTGYAYSISRVANDRFHTAGFNPKGPPVPLRKTVVEADYFHSGYVQ